MKCNLCGKNELVYLCMSEATSRDTIFSFLFFFFYRKKKEIRKEGEVKRVLSKCFSFRFNDSMLSTVP